MYLCACVMCEHVCVYTCIQVYERMCCMFVCASMCMHVPCVFVCARMCICALCGSVASVRLQSVQLPQVQVQSLPPAPAPTPPLCPRPVWPERVHRPRIPEPSGRQSLLTLRQAPGLSFPRCRGGRWPRGVSGRRCAGGHAEPPWAGERVPGGGVVRPQGCWGCRGSHREASALSLQGRPPAAPRAERSRLLGKETAARQADRSQGPGAAAPAPAPPVLPGARARTWRRARGWRCQACLLHTSLSDPPAPGLSARLLVLWHREH